jgi:hypothetical protein
VCGCNAVESCGAADSGRVCDAGSHQCQAGCRNGGGNGCPAGLVCTGTGSLPGSCVVPVDMSVPPDMSRNLDMSAAPDMRSPYGLTGGGLACDVGGHGSPATGGLLMLALLCLVARARRRVSK